MSIIKNTQIMKKLIWLPIIGEMILLPNITAFNHLNEFFPSKRSIIAYIIYQTIMWALLGLAIVVFFL
jgi:hypothetical protein